jgi:TatD DNase family protein
MGSPEAAPLIDTHCHLDYDYAPKTTEDLLREAESVGISTLVTIGTEISSIPKVQALSDQYKNVFHTVGVHPHEAVTMKDQDLETLRAAAKHPKCRAIGEIGLDFHYDHSPPDVQQKRLAEQLKLALEVQLPVVIHSREAEEKLLELLTEYAGKVTKDRAPGIIHCFSGTEAFGEACLKLGFYLSFSGIVTFKNAESLRECAKKFPLEKMLVETDSPYLAPIPYRGKKCEPSMVRHTAMKIAELKGLTLDEVARTTTSNARRVFGI